jgi:hypothetical protein
LREGDSKGGQGKKTPERVKCSRLHSVPDKEDSRKGQDKKTPVEGRTKKSPDRFK